MFPYKEPRYLLDALHIQCFFIPIKMYAQTALRSLQACAYFFFLQKQSVLVNFVAHSGPLSNLSRTMGGGSWSSAHWRSGSGFPQNGQVSSVKIFMFYSPSSGVR